MANRNHDPKKTHEIALSGLLFALAMALSFIEGTLVIPGLAPGMKLGLANIVVMYALFFMGARQALYLDLLKALFVFLVSGWTAGFLSLCGGLLSLLVMWVLYYKLPFRPTWFILSVCGALAHNIGQLLGAGLILSSAMSLYYAPVMLVLGLIPGQPQPSQKQFEMRVWDALAPGELKVFVDGACLSMPSAAVRCGKADHSRL